MITLQELRGMTLRWRRVSLFSRSHELFTGTGVAARLDGPSTLFGRVSTAEGFGGKWEFQQRGVFGNTVEIREAGHHMPFAILRVNPWRSTSVLELPKGERWTLRYRFWKGIMEAEDKGGPILACSSVLSLADSAVVTFPADVSKIERVPWIPMLLFMLLSGHRRSAAAG